MTDAQDFFERVRHYELQDSKAVIRRYFTQEKFDDLLDSGELYFSPASTFADPLEGFYLERDFANLESSLRWIGKKIIGMIRNSLCVLHVRLGIRTRWNRRKL